MLPGKPIVITPPHVQLHTDPAVSAGVPPIIVLGAPGFHGPSGTGTHGIGVSTPKAADVAAATCGFVRLEHTPNGGMLVIGMMSLIVAAGLFSISTRLSGSTFNADGATPKLHVSTALAVTFGGMLIPYRFEPLTDAVSSSPVVVMMQTTLRSLPSFQLRADGNR
jgi:hypothetical protein